MRIFPIFYPKPSNRLKSILTSAKPGEGKGLDAIRTGNGLRISYRRARKWLTANRYRMLLTNIAFKGPLREELEKNGQYFFWSSPREIRYCLRKNCWRTEKRHIQHDADIFVDEMNNIFPADKYAETPGWLRRLFAQHRHDTSRVYAWTQDYKSVDINFRRMVSVAYTIERLCGSPDVGDTLPPVRFVWGIVIKRKFDPRDLEVQGVQDKKKLAKLADEQGTGMPSFFFIRRCLTDEYNTLQLLSEYHASKMEEIVMECEHGPACSDPRHRFKVIHRPI